LLSQEDPGELRLVLLARLSEVQLGELKINAAFFEEGEDEGAENTSCFFCCCFVLECVFVFVRVCPEPVLAKHRCFKHKKRETDRERERQNSNERCCHFSSSLFFAGGWDDDDDPEVRKRLFGAIFILKMIILPRQARDEHRESTQHQTVFSQDTDSDEDELWEAVAEEMAGGRRPLDCQIKCVPCYIFLRSGEYIPITTLSLPPARNCCWKLPLNTWF
jgi:hypothetical protein